MSEALVKREQLSAMQVMGMNRATRRAIGKANGVKIPGVDQARIERERLTKKKV